MGGDDAGLAATKQANNEAIADTARRIAASADARKDTIEQTYIGNKNALADSQNAATGRCKKCPVAATGKSKGGQKWRHPSAWGGIGAPRGWGFIAFY